MTELTPPPERPLPDDARARIRAELLEHAHEHRSSAPRWLVPASAAAAVALVAGVAFWAVNAGDSGDRGLPVTGGGPASGQAAPSASGAGPSSDGTSTPSVVGPETAYTTMPSDGGVQVGKGTCETELENVLNRADDVFDAAPDISFWVKREQFTLCHTSPDFTTVTHPLPLIATTHVEAFRVVSVPAQHAGSGDLFVAGGVVPDGVLAFAVEYTFPDGETVPAQTGTDADGRSWWWMEHTSPAHQGNVSKQPEIEVTVSLSGTQKHYTLEWGIDTCAQANHGC
jgi:hypothetical protein